MPPTTPVLDNFNRANGAPGANWPGPIRSSKTLFTITSNAAACSAGGVTQEGYWTAQFGAAQEVFLTVPTLPAAGSFLRLHLRIQNPGAASPTYYLLQYNPGTPGNVEIDYFDGTNYTAISSVVNLTLAAGDKLLLRAVGSSIVAEAYQSGAWSQVASATDSNITGAGYIGFAVADTTVRADDFGGGVFASSPAVRAARVMDARMVAAPLAPESLLIAPRRTSGAQSARGRWQFIQADAPLQTPARTTQAGSLILPVPRSGGATAPTKAGAPPIIADSPSALAEAFDSIMLPVPRTLPTAPINRAPALMVADGATMQPEPVDATIISVPRLALSRWPLGVLVTDGVQIIARGESLILSFPHGAARAPLGLLLSEGVIAPSIAGESLLLSVPRPVWARAPALLLSEGALIAPTGDALIISVPRAMLGRAPAFIIADAVQSTLAGGETILIALPREPMLRFRGALHGRAALLSATDGRLSGRDYALRGMSAGDY